MAELSRNGMMVYLGSINGYLSRIVLWLSFDFHFHLPMPNILNTEWQSEIFTLAIKV